MLQTVKSRDRVPMRWIFLNLRNPSSRTMAPRSTQPLTEMSTRNLPGGKGRPARRAVNLTAICEPIVKTKCGSLDVSHSPMAFTACYRDSFFLAIVTKTKLRGRSPQANCTDRALVGEFSANLCW
jgi:hypothetical protein